MKKVLVLAAVAMLCSQSYAAMEMSLARAVEMIRAESQDLKKAEANLKRARAGLDAANAARRFRLEGSATYMNLINVERPGRPSLLDLSSFSSMLPSDAPAFIEMPDNVGMLGVSLTQPIYTFGRIGNALDAARHAIRMADSGSELARREIEAMAVQVYWTAKMSDEVVKIAQRNLQSSVTAERQLVSAGRAGRQNLVKISADIAAKEIALSDAQFNRDSAHRLLKVVAGIDADEELILTDGFPGSFAELDAPATLQSNPEWDVLEAQVRMHRSQAAARRAEIRPVLAATASYNYIAIHDSPQLWQADGSQSASAGIALSIPLWDGGSSRASATMDRMAAEAARQDLDRSRRMRANEYREAVLNHARLRTNLDRLKTARDLAAKTVQISTDRFAAGQTSAIELSDVQAALVQMDMAVLNAKLGILMAEETVRKLNGRQ
jgi:outer membrane protein TolC